MAYVSVPKDLTKIKNRVVLNLTVRQLACFGAGAALGLPFYFLTKGAVGTSNAAVGMVAFMVPAFLFAMYEKDGQPLEKVLLDILKVKLLRPPIRRYEARNLYEGPRSAVPGGAVGTSGKGTGGNRGRQPSKAKAQKERPSAWPEGSGNGTGRKG